MNFDFDCKSVGFVSHLTRQRVFARATFGPDERMEGVIKHIEKELIEVRNAAPGVDRIREWVDVVILGLDGLMRCVGVARPGLSADHIAECAFAAILDKQVANEARVWTDWRTADPGAPIEHTKLDGEPS